MKDYRGGGSAGYANSGGWGNVNSFYDRKLESTVRHIVADMGGVPPCGNAWAMTFGGNEIYFREGVERSPGVAYGISAPSSDIEKIDLAYRLVVAGWRK